jgi:hypothetical protein
METFDRIYKKNDDFVFRKIEDETLLVPIRDNIGDMGFLYSLNEVGTFIWYQIDNRKRLHHIVDSIHKEFDVSCEQAQSDLCEFINDLQDIGAIIACGKVC